MEPEASARAIVRAIQNTGRLRADRRSSAGVAAAAAHESDGSGAGAEISTKHMSFLETGRALPSAATWCCGWPSGWTCRCGSATRFLWRPASRRSSATALDDPALEAARRRSICCWQGHEPYPALAVDRRWILIADSPRGPPVSGRGGALLAPPVNVLRLSLHPEGLAPRIANLPGSRAHLLERLRRRLWVSADAEAFRELMGELRAYPVPRGPPAPRPGGHARLRRHGGATAAHPPKHGQPTLLLSTTTVFGTPVDITLVGTRAQIVLPRRRSHRRHPAPPRGRKIRLSISATFSAVIIRETCPREGGERMIQ